jgi:hypothetical protein
MSIKKYICAFALVILLFAPMSILGGCSEKEKIVYVDRYNENPATDTAVQNEQINPYIGVFTSIWLEGANNSIGALNWEFKLTINKDNTFELERKTSTTTTITGTWVGNKSPNQYAIACFTKFDSISISQENSKYFTLTELEDGEFVAASAYGNQNAFWSNNSIGAVIIFTKQ